MKNIIITGAAQGIGYYLVKQLLDDQFNVTVLDIDIDSLKGLSKEWPSLLTLVCDVRDANRIKELLKRAFSKFGAWIVRFIMPVDAHLGR